MTKRALSYGSSPSTRWLPALINGLCPPVRASGFMRGRQGPWHDRDRSTVWCSVACRGSDARAPRPNWRSAGNYGAVASAIESTSQSSAGGAGSTWHSLARRLRCSWTGASGTGVPSTGRCRRTTESGGRQSWRRTLAGTSTPTMRSQRLGGWRSGSGNTRNRGSRQRTWQSYSPTAIAPFEWRGSEWLAVGLFGRGRHDVRQMTATW